MTEVTSAIRATFAAAGAVGHLHVREIGTNYEVGLGADDAVVLASVFKVPVAVAFEREVSAGRLEPTDRTVVTDRYKTGGVGTAGCQDDVEMSWRDLAHLMLTLSDNAATDLIYHRVGQGAIDTVLADVGLANTRVVGSCEDILISMGNELGAEWRSPEFDALVSSLAPERVKTLAVLDPQQASSSTAREMTTLLEAIWTNRAAPGDACQRIRTTMTQQIWPHRLTAGFGQDVRVAGKTGTLPGIRNEVGVVTYPDEKSYAVAVFTRCESIELNLPDVDRSIGRAARIGIESLRDHST